MENRLNGFLRERAEETVRNGSRITSVDLNHRAEATVLMRSLRVVLRCVRLETRSASLTKNFFRKNKNVRTLLRPFTPLPLAVGQFPSPAF